MHTTDLNRVPENASTALQIFWYAQSKLANFQQKSAFVKEQLKEIA